MPQVDLVGTAAQTVEQHKHGLAVIRGERSKLLFREEDRPLRETRWQRILSGLVRPLGIVGFFVRLHHKVNGELSTEHGIIGLEHLPFVVDGDVTVLD